MLDSPILDVAIGLVFIFLLLSLIATALQEALQTVLKSRAVQLEAGIREMLNDAAGAGLAKQFFDHPLVAGLFHGQYDPRKARNLPSYIPARTFALALFDLISRGANAKDATAASAAAPTISLEGVRLAVHRIQNPPVQRALLTAIDMAQGDLNRAQANVEQWYDSCMDRVSGWYKRNTQKTLLAIGLGLAVLSNADALAIARYLASEKGAREAIVAQAGAFAADKANQAQPIDSLIARFDSLPLGISTSHFRLPWQTEHLWLDFFGPLLGWIVTALAVSLGAPFWFDLLNKFMSVRSTKKPDEKGPGDSPAAPNPPQVAAAPLVAAGYPAPASAATMADAFTRQQWSLGPDPDEGVL